MILVKGKKYLVASLSTPDEWVEGICNSLNQEENCVSSFINEEGRLVAMVFSHDVDKRVKEI